MTDVEDYGREWVRYQYSFDLILSPSCPRLHALFFDVSPSHDGRYVRAQDFCELKARVPAGHIEVGAIRQEIGQSPDFSWAIDQTFFLAPAEDPEMDWLLYSIAFDNLCHRYVIESLAEVRGLPEPELAAGAMLEETFDFWGAVESDSFPGWQLVDRLVEEFV
jgi:hypothetical protein